MKPEGDFQAKIRSWINTAIILFVICYASLTTITLISLPPVAERFREFPPLMLPGLLTMLAVANIPREIAAGRDFRAFLSSAATIAGLMALFGIGMFPNLVLSNPSPELSLGIYDAASSQKTLRIMLIIACTGVPFVLAYTASIYWIFRGKVKLDSTSY